MEFRQIVKSCGVIAVMFFVLTGFVANASAGQEATSSSETQAEYVIGLGDQLQIMVWKEPELTQAMSVRIDGRISLPLVGDVEAAGKTIRDLKKILEGKYATVISEPAVSVMLVQSKSLRYYIIGKVAQPGEFPIDFPITVLQAIAKSGGFQEWAKTDKISIVRREGGRETISSFNYEALVNGQNLEQNALVKPGDTIIIP
ncbi:MAG: polysaccharide export protein [Desulfobulbaceae bacterium]|nr:polysaccharide export protein [Desulfobulbaceae bacterium]